MPNLNIQLSFTLNHEKHKEAEQPKEVPEEITLEEEPQETIEINKEPEITLDECLGNSGKADKTCSIYKRKIQDMISWVSFHETFNNKEKQNEIIKQINKIEGLSNRKQYLSAFKLTLNQLNIDDMCGLNEELEKIFTETQDKISIETKQNLKPIEEASMIMEWLNKKLEKYKQLSITGDTSNKYWNNQMWALLEIYIKEGVLRSDEIRNMRIRDEDYNPNIDYYDYDYNIYFKKSGTIVLINHKTDKKAQGKEKLKVRVFQCELESVLHREESDNIFFQQKTNRGQIYKDTSGLNKALTTALDIKGLKKTIGRDDLKIKDLRHAKVSVIFNTKDKDKINHLILHYNLIKILKEPK